MKVLVIISEELYHEMNYITLENTNGGSKIQLSFSNNFLIILVSWATK